MVALRCLVACCLLGATASCHVEAKEQVPLAKGAKFTTHDTLDCGEEANADARECLEALRWAPGEFSVELQTAEPGCGDWLVRFPSARPIGNAINDRVAMEWFAARDEQGAVRKARAVVVVHESGKRMTVGRLIARGISGHGLHAFLLQLPGYGARRDEKLTDIERGLNSMQQAISDVRRARDAVAALPVVDDSTVAVQGTSLGGFVVSTVAGLDHGYERVFILLAGGDLQEVIFNGAKDAAKTRRKLAEAGVTDEQIRELARQVEPLRLAHRIDPAATWLYSGKYDDVVPPQCSAALAKAAKLPLGHHIEMDADHYSGFIQLPKVVRAICEETAAPAAAGVQQSGSP
ncbi:alpha/beta hydrolase family protein [Lacipirellula sp.]|uniref:alpha/beta hydrolase family protein n=1 Tax=Lacipirellula sp. TaxID=2691419 RepID=UPI003D120F87